MKTLEKPCRNQETLYIHPLKRKNIQKKGESCFRPRHRLDLVQWVGTTLRWLRTSSSHLQVEISGEECSQMKRFGDEDQRKGDSRWKRARWVLARTSVGKSVEISYIFFHHGPLWWKSCTSFRRWSCNTMTWTLQLFLLIGSLIFF